MDEVKLPEFSPTIPIDELIFVFSYFEFKIRLGIDPSFEKQKNPAFEPYWFLGVRTITPKSKTFSHAWLILVEFT